MCLPEEASLSVRYYEIFVLNVSLSISGMRTRAIVIFNISTHNELTLLNLVELALQQTSVVNVISGGQELEVLHSFRNDIIRQLKY